MHQQTIMHLYNRMHRLFFQRMTDDCQHLQLHPGQVPLLKCLRTMGSGSQAQISKELHVSAAAVAVSVKRLEKQGMIKRYANPQNLRENIISLTELGQRESDAIDRAFKKVISQALKGIDESETRVLAQVLDKICANLDPSNNKEKKEQDAQTV